MLTTTQMTQAQETFVPETQETSELLTQAEQIQAVSESPRLGLVPVIIY